MQNAICNWRVIFCLSIIDKYFEKAVYDNENQVILDDYFTEKILEFLELWKTSVKPLQQKKA